MIQSRNLTRKYQEIIRKLTAAARRNEASAFERVKRSCGQFAHASVKEGRPARVLVAPGERLQWNPSSRRQGAGTLEAVDDHLRFDANLLVEEEVIHVGALVPRQLDDITEFGVLRHGTIAVKVLLEPATRV